MGRVRSPAAARTVMRWARAGAVRARRVVVRSTLAQRLWEAMAEDMFIFRGCLRARPTLREQMTGTPARPVSLSIREISKLFYVMMSELSQKPKKRRLRSGALSQPLAENASFEAEACCRDPSGHEFEFYFTRRTVLYSSLPCCTAGLLMTVDWRPLHQLMGHDRAFSHGKMQTIYRNGSIGCHA